MCGYLPNTTTRRLLPTVSNRIHRDLPITQFWVKSDHFGILDLHPRRGLNLVCFITLPPRVSKTLENLSGNRWYVESSQGTLQRLSCRNRDPRVRPAIPTRDNSGLKQFDPSRALSCQLVQRLFHLFGEGDGATIYLVQTY